jgi:hypothetical protein
VSVPLTPYRTAAPEPPNERYTRLTPPVDDDLSPALGWDACAPKASFVRGASAPLLVLALLGLCVATMILFRPIVPGPIDSVLHGPDQMNLRTVKR